MSIPANTDAQVVVDPAVGKAPSVATEKVIVDTAAEPVVKRVHTTANLQRCKDAADIAFQLIEHLAKNGKVVDRNDYDAVYVVTQINTGDISAQDEHDFWLAYAKIVNALDEQDDPEGIYFTSLYEMQKSRELSPAADSHRRELSNRSRFLVWFSMALLLALIGLLAYGNLLTNMVRAINVLTVEQQSIFFDSLEGTRLGAIVSDTCNTETGLQPVCNDAIADIQDEITSAVSLIDYWIFWAETGETAKAKAYARQMFILLENYIYPLLAGALGACVSLLRQIFAQLREKKLHLRLFQSLELRIAVGTIAGIVVGWLSSPDLSSGISLTPLALAFAAGYAVEIIYDLLDRIVAAFSSDPTKR